MSRYLDSLPQLDHEQGRQYLITPYFQVMNVFNRAQSQVSAKPVYDLMEVVQLRMAGDRNYSPVFPADAMSHLDDNGRMVTYAERWGEQYRAFISGDDQRAGGTALEMLSDFGITPAQISICKALNIHSIETLIELPQEKVKNLGMSGNALKAMAGRWQSAQSNRNNDDIAALKARLAELEAERALPVAPADDEKYEEALKAADDEFSSRSDQELRDYIKEKTGHGPVGRLSRESLLELAREV